MVPSYLLLVTLAVSTKSWPQLPSSAPTIPYAPRSLPVVDDAGTTLHIPSAERRALPTLPDDLEESLGTLPVSLKRALPSAADLSPGTVTLPVIHAPKPGLVGRNIEVQLENRSDVAYYAQLSIGTPPQDVYAQLDTGSFELWVNPDCSSLSSSADKTFCRAVGHYDPGDSSTSRNTGDTGELSYGVGSAKISYYVDDVAFSDDVKLRKVRFGVANGGTEDQFAGVMGIGYGKGINTEHGTVVDEMASQGVIATKTFSVALGSKSEDGGVLVLGGVDAGKFGGTLARLPIIPADDSPDGVARYWVAMKSISHSPPTGSSSVWDGSQMSVFLDTGATLTLLPSSLVKTIADDLGSSGLDDAGFYTLNCDLVDQDGSVDFAFDGVIIRVPYREVIRHFHNGQEESCYLGIVPSEDYALLGDTFLRSAYVVFDLESDAVYMAQYQNCGSTVSSIKKSSDLTELQGSCGGGSGDTKSDDDEKEEKEEEEEEDKGDNSTDDENDDGETDDEKTSTTTEPTSESTAAATTTSGGLRNLEETISTTDAPQSSSVSATTTASKPKSTGSTEQDSEDTDEGTSDAAKAEESSDEDGQDSSATQQGGQSLAVAWALGMVIVMAML